MLSKGLSSSLYEYPKTFSLGRFLVSVSLPYYTIRLPNFNFISTVFGINLHRLLYLPEILYVLVGRLQFLFLCLAHLENTYIARASRIDETSANRAN